MPRLLTHPYAADAVPVPDRIIAVDWSGDKGPGQKKKIWAAVWTRSPKRRKPALTLESGRTRAELTAHLIALAGETPALVVGIDCCFSYPAWFLAEHSCRTVFDLWAHVTAGHGERWLGEGCPPAERDLRFWGKPHKRPLEFSGPNLPRMMRLTDMDNKIDQAKEGGDPARAALMFGVGAKSPFQIGGAGSVGTGSLRGMQWLQQLHQNGFRVWPFEDASPTQPLLVEIYTRLLTGPVKKSNALARHEYLALRRLNRDPLYRTLKPDILASAESSEDAFDALVCCLEMVRHQAHFATLRATPDPQLALEGITWRPGL